MDLRHLALILHAGWQEAIELEDVSLAAALGAMANRAVDLHELREVEEEVEAQYDDLASRYRGKRAQ